jgi:mono/diheme cytochrome c family protein
MKKAKGMKMICLSVMLIGPVSIAAAAPPDGRALFTEKCLMCHGKGGMGTGLLSRRVQPPELLLRDNLVAGFVTQAARIGIGNMPAMTRGEVSDAQLDAIAKFLEDNSRQHR